MLDLKCHPITNYVIECSSKSSLWIQFLCTANLATMATTEDIGYYDYRPVTLLFAYFISFQRYALS